MNGVSPLTLRPGQIVMIPGLPDRFECLYVGDYKANVKRLSDGAVFGIDFETVVDICECQIHSESGTVPFEAATINDPPTPPSIAAA